MIQPPISIVIGATQMGKSSFLNYMQFGNDWAIRTNPALLDVVSPNRALVGQGLLPCTDTCAVYGVMYNNGQPIFLLDTPGFEDERKQQDLDTVDIMLSLHDFQHFSVPVLIHQYGRPFTASYNEALKEYHAMMPSMFDRGLILVVSKFIDTDEARDRRANDPDYDPHFLPRLANEISARFGMHEGQLTIITLDSRPYSAAEKESSALKRGFILNYLANCECLDIATARFRKPAGWRVECAREVIVLDTYIEGYTARMLEVDKSLATVLPQLATVNTKMFATLTALYRAEQRLSDIRAQTNVLMDSVTANTGREVFYQHWTWDLTVPHNITVRRRITTTDCVMTIRHDNIRRDAGQLRSTFLGRICAQILLYTDPQTMFEREIQTLQAEIESKTQARNLLDDQLRAVQGQATGLEAQMQSMAALVNSSNEQKLRLEEEFVSMQGLLEKYPNANRRRPLALTVPADEGFRAIIDARGSADREQRLLMPGEN